MFNTRFVVPLFRSPEPLDYARALGVAGGAVLCRAVLETVAPGIAYLVILLPAVVVAGVFWGVLPALTAAITGVASISILFVGRPLTAWPPFNSTQVDVLAFIPACAAVLWATHALRLLAANSAAAEARLAEVFRQIPGAAAILEAPEGRLLLRSSQSDVVLAQPEQKLRHSSDLGSYGGLHADGRPFAFDEYPIIRALKTGEIIRGEHVRYRRADNDLIDLEVHAGPVRGTDGHIQAAVGMAFDITERVRGEQQLQDSEARFRATTERLRAAISVGTLGLWELDLITQRVWLDANLAAMFGLPAQPTELDRADMMRFGHPADRSRANEVLAKALQAGAPYVDELHVLTAQNQERWFVANGARLPGTQKVVGVIRDATHQREREEALQAALDARELLVREADHRIKNSLQLVTSLLRMQLKRVEDPDARQALESAMTRVTAVSDAHLALQHSPNLKSVEIDRILDDLCGRVALLNPAITVRCDAAVGLWLDAEMAIPLGLIASELLTNALRHAFPAGKSGTVTLSAAAQEGILQMTIKDDGVGLPENLGQHGLGTMVMAALTKQIGATLQTRSQSGLGTTVTVHLELPTVSEVVAIQTRRETALDGRNDR